MDKDTSFTKHKIPKKDRWYGSKIKIILCIFVFLLAIFVGYFLGTHTQTDRISIVKPREPREKEIVKKQIIPQKPLEKKIIKKIKKNKKLSSKIQNTKLKHFSGKPKLVIIIDDVHSKQQLRVIKSLGLKITPSIFPPYSLAKHTDNLTKNLKHFMIHLPMQSSSIQFNSQDNTLMTTFSNKKIEHFIKKLRRLFPRAKYINNHTGSVFTQDYEAMKNLYSILRKEGFIFIDSYTTAFSKVHQIANEYGDAYVSRDIFLDNQDSMRNVYIKLHQGIEIARKQGYAIIIGHPHKNTMLALKHAGNILSKVDVVYIDEIFQK